MIEGLPNLQHLGKLRIGENVQEMLGSDLEVEKGSLGALKDGIATCEATRDYVSRELLEHILEDTEEHIDFIETQLELIEKVGIQNYLPSQMEPGAPS